MDVGGVRTMISADESDSGRLVPADITVLIAPPTVQGGEPTMLTELQDTQRSVLTTDLAALLTDNLAASGSVQSEHLTILVRVVELPSLYASEFSESDMQSQLGRVVETARCLTCVVFGGTFDKDFTIYRPKAYIPPITLVQLDSVAGVYALDEIPISLPLNSISRARLRNEVARIAQPMAELLVAMSWYSAAEYSKAGDLLGAISEAIGTHEDTDRLAGLTALLAGNSYIREGTDLPRAQMYFRVAQGLLREPERLRAELGLTETFLLAKASKCTDMATAFDPHPFGASLKDILGRAAAIGYHRVEILALMQLGKAFFCGGVSRGELGYLRTAETFYMEAIVMITGEEIPQVSLNTVALARAGLASTQLLLPESLADGAKQVAAGLCLALSEATDARTVEAIGELLMSVLSSQGNIGSADDLQSDLAALEYSLDYSAADKVRALRDVQDRTC